MKILSSLALGLLFSTAAVAADSPIVGTWNLTGIYRDVNGVRGGRYWQWAGKWAARADDVLSWVPARITAALLALAASEIM